MTNSAPPPDDSRSAGTPRDRDTHRFQVFEVEILRGVLVITPQGDTTGFRYNQVHVESGLLLEHVDQDAVRGVIFDLSRVVVIGSVMISVLIKIARRVQQKQGEAVFCHASSTMRDALHTMNLTRLWPCLESRQDALRHFR